MLLLPTHLIKEGLQFVIGVFQQLWHNPRLGKDRHEVRIAVPAGHDVDVQVLVNPRAGGPSQVRADVETFRVHHIDYRKTFLSVFPEMAPTKKDKARAQSFLEKNKKDNPDIYKTSDN